MKFYSALAALAVLSGNASANDGVRGGMASQRKLATIAIPAQTFYVPLPEDDLMFKTFETIHSDAGGDVATIISITTSTDNTIIWYDEHEDGFEPDITNPVQGTTKIWGNGDSSDGCHPGVATCTDSNDIIMAGDAILIENDVDVGNSRQSDDIYYDGGDKIQANYGIAVTRGAYPTATGSLMAGGVEVLDTTQWGTDFIAPLGEDTSANDQAFEYTALYFQAKEAGTVITRGNNQYTLGEGETVILDDVQEGEAVTASKAVQCDIITGDVSSNYELRWFSLRDTAQWSNEYLTPTGDSTAPAAVLLYNPNSSQITVTYTMSMWGWQFSYTVNVPAGGTAWTNSIPDGSGSYLTSDKNFLAFSIIDTDGSGKTNDWGHPIQPVDKLTSQVLIGWGYGCTGATCDSRKQSRSVVKVSPMDNCVIHVDFNNDGVMDWEFELGQYEGKIIADDDASTNGQADQDMTGAMIYATTGWSLSSTPVPIAASWGQDAGRSYGSQSVALDLGTTVLPFYGIQVVKSAALWDDVNRDQLYGPGDKILYTITVTNLGGADILANQYYVKDTLDASVTYVAGSAKFEGQQISTGSVFPFSGAGVRNTETLGRRGETHTYTFEVVIDAMSASSDGIVLNEGTVSHGSSEYPYSVEVPVVYTADITVAKTVYTGNDGGASCTGTLAPGDSVTLFYETAIDGSVNYDATAVGTPSFPDSTPVPGLVPVGDKDPAAVAEVAGGTVC